MAPVTNLPSFMVEALRLIEYCVKNYPDSITILPPTISKVKREKKNSNGSIVRPATVEIVVPDRVAAKLKSEESKDIMYITWIREEVLERAESGVVLPGEH